MHHHSTHHRAEMRAQIWLGDHCTRPQGSLPCRRLAHLPSQLRPPAGGPLVPVPWWGIPFCDCCELPRRHFTWPTSSSWQWTAATCEDTLGIGAKLHNDRGRGFVLVFLFHFTPFSRDFQALLGHESRN